MALRSLQPAAGEMIEWLPSAGASVIAIQSRAKPILLPSIRKPEGAAELTARDDS
jgi:hypothetical protein